jgi:hypothetical protein
MANVEIERLSLQVPGLSMEQGRRLAEMVAARLAEARLTPVNGTDKVDVAVAAPGAGASLEQLTSAIVEQIQRSMA